MRKWLLAWALSALTVPVLAQGITSVFPGPGTPASAAASFQGPGDIKTITLWYGIIAYSAAYASGTGASFDFSCNSGALTGTVNFQSAGTLNVTPVASCSGTISVTKLYNQSNRTFCGGSTPCDIGTIGAGTLVFLQSGCPATSVVTYCLSGSGLNMKSANAPPDQTTAFSMLGVYDRPTSARGSYSTLFGSASTVIAMGASTNNDKAFIDEGTPVDVTMTDGTLHTMVGVFDDAGAGSSLKIDAAAPTGVTIGTQQWNSSPAPGIGQLTVFNGIFYGTGVAFSTSLTVTEGNNLANVLCKDSGSAAAPGC